MRHLTLLLTFTLVLAFSLADAHARKRTPRPRRIGYSVTLGGNTFRIWGAGRTGIMPKGVSVSPDGKRIYVTNFGRRHRHNLDVYNAKTFLPVRKVSFRGNTIESVVSADSKTLFVSNYYGYKIQALDTKTFKPRWSTKTGHFPKMMVLSPDGKTLYVSSWESATVSKLNAATGKILATSKVGRHPRGVSVSPDGKILYVDTDVKSNSAGDDLVERLRALGVRHR